VRRASAAESWIRRVEADGCERTTVRQYRQHVDLHIMSRIGRTNPDFSHHLCTIEEIRARICAV
jgi:hypothetical protein